MTEHFNGLSPAEDERISMLVEECCEVGQVGMKISRHGYESHNPTYFGAPTNRKHLEKEIGDVFAMAELMSSRGDIDMDNVMACMNMKLETVKQWTHHQEWPDESKESADSQNVGKSS